MADTHLMEEELQQSVRVAGGAEEDEEMVDVHNMSNAAAFDSNRQAGVHFRDQDEAEYDGQDEDGEDGDGESSNDQDAFWSEDDADDAEGEEDGDTDENDDEEDDNTVRPRRIVGRTSKSIEVDEDDDDEDEGVGAVKIRPGETDDDDESEGKSRFESDHSDAESGADDVAWDDEAAENDDEEGSEVVNSGLCMFCKQDEEDDPGEEFEPYLTCRGCGENSHQQCARDAEALHGQQSPANWRCLDCAGDGGHDEEAEESARGHGKRSTVNGITDAEATPGFRRASAPKLARDLLPSHKGTIKPDSHSMFNQLVLDEDPMDGSRILRKRKTSSVSAADEAVTSLAKRRKNTSESNDEGVQLDEATKRTLRLKVNTSPAAIVKNTRSSLVVRLKVNPPDLRQVVSQKPKGLKKRPYKSRRRKQPTQCNGAPPAASPTQPAAPIETPIYTQPFYSFYDKETDETKGKPYGGILTEAEADTSKTLPDQDDRKRFDEAKRHAKEVWDQRRPKVSSVEVPERRKKKNVGPASQITCINFGGFEIDTWYAAPYPEEYTNNQVLFICEFCLKYMSSDYVAWRHKLKCPVKHPPGDEIYRHGSISFFEVDGRKNPVYCQNLCLLAKLFLGSKTLYYDVEPFLFYVLCEYDDFGFHFVGYFSKEKRASSQNNVSCILTLPIHQRKGYGNLLIDFSYLLTRVERKTGSPEKPLSDMGLVSYRNYWRLIMCRYLIERFPEGVPCNKVGLSITQISADTGLTCDDVISALEGLRCLVRDPETKMYAFRADLPFCREHVAKWEAKKYVQLNPKALTWTPYVMGRSNATNFELGPALTAIAPREDDQDQKNGGTAGDKGPNGDRQIKANHASQAAKPEVSVAVLESTEPNETGKGAEATAVTKEAQVNGVSVDGNAESATPKASAEDETGPESEADGWVKPYSAIPPSRFEVYPPITGGRRGGDRSRFGVSRTPVVRSLVTPKPRPKRPMSSRKSTSSRPRSSSKRKPGGTGRGPGRWPKGTKKSDYGNAESGPGFPPGWQPVESDLVGLGKEDHHDTVQVSAPAVQGPFANASSGLNVDVAMSGTGANYEEDA